MHAAGRVLGADREHAEIVLGGNGNDPSAGINVWEDSSDNWVRTRRVWNQHAYAITHITESGTVPAMMEVNWLNERYNNFRQNVQPDGLFDAPDLVAVDLVVSTRGCPSELRPSVRVLNRGRSGAPAGVPVSFYEGEGAARTLLGRATTTRPLLPGESELLTLEPPFAVPAERGAEVFVFEAVVNDPEDMPLAGLNECRPENNGAGPVEASCPLVE